MPPLTLADEDGSSVMNGANQEEYILEEVSSCNTTLTSIYIYLNHESIKTNNPTPLIS